VAIASPKSQQNSFQIPLRGAFRPLTLISGQGKTSKPIPVGTHHVEKTGHNPAFDPSHAPCPPKVLFVPLVGARRPDA
jgi:hypothetical protein